MENNERFVSTPLVNVGSPQYLEDATIMRLFDDYDQYLQYLGVWQSDWTSLHPSASFSDTELLDMVSDTEPASFKEWMYPMLIALAKPAFIPVALLFR